MFNEEIRAMLGEVIRSWQVIAVTIVLVIYLTIVKNVARTQHRHRIPSIPKVKKEKAPTPMPDSELAPGSDDSDELGLEEAYDE